MTMGKKQRSVKRKKRGITEKERWAIYGLNRPSNPRYSGIKGIYWAVVSEFVRRRDYNMWGVCINCGREVGNWRDLQAGHYVSAQKGGFSLLFDLRNVNGECGGCNLGDKQKFRYKRNLDVRYGVGTAEALEIRYLESNKIGKTVKSWSDLEYERQIKHLQGEIETLGYAH